VQRSPLTAIEDNRIDIRSGRAVAVAVPDVEITVVTGSKRGLGGGVLGQPRNIKLNARSQAGELPPRAFPAAGTQDGAPFWLAWQGNSDPPRFESKNLIGAMLGHFLFRYPVQPLAR